MKSEHSERSNWWSRNSGRPLDETEMAASRTGGLTNLGASSHGCEQVALNCFIHKCLVSGGLLGR